jgi:predicted aspartyl protease
MPLIYVDQKTMKTAQDDSRFDIYAGKIKIDGQEFDIPIHVGSGIPEVLLGRQWLTTRRLVVDMPSGILTLG